MQKGRRQALSVVLSQVLVGALVAIVCYAIEGARAGASALLGTGIGVAATSLMALAMLRHGEGVSAARATIGFLTGWLVNGASFWIAFRAVGIQAPFSAALFLQSLLAMAVAIPSAPGFFGLFEAGAKVALGVYLIDDTLAVSYALGYHLLSFIPITLIGFWYLARMGLHLKDMSDGRRETGDGTS